jgi:hypothetical protein
MDIWLPEHKYPPDENDAYVIANDIPKQPSADSSVCVQSIEQTDTQQFLCGWAKEGDSFQQYSGSKVELLLRPGEWMLRGN